MSFVRLGTAMAVISSAVMPTLALAADMPVKATIGAPAAAPVILFQDTTIGYNYEFDGKTPNATYSIPKQVFEVQHIDTWTYGTNFFLVQLLKSGSIDPASPSRTPGVGDGALEVYGLYRGTLSGNALTGTKMFSVGPIRDVSFIFGGDLEAKNNYFAAQKRDYVFGGQVSFDVPGYLTVALNYYQEYNHNGVAQGLIAAGLLRPNANNDMLGKVSYDPTAEIEVAYMQPLTFTGLPLKVQGFVNFVLPKGLDAYGAKTVTEIYSQNRLLLDVTKMLDIKGPKTEVFVGYKYWGNKFGGDSKIYSGSVESQVTAGFQVHI